MPFKKPDGKAGSKDSQSSTKARKIFIGRTQELDFFVEKILKPDEPAHNIISISGEGGIGKTELLHQFRDKVGSPEFKEDCLTAWADERQTTPAAIMEKFAKDLPKEGDFEKALDKYKMLVLKQKSAREAAREFAMSKAPDIGGAVASMVPVAGDLLKLGVSTGLGALADADLNRQVYKDAKRLEHPVGDLTSAFVQHINGLVDPNRGKHWRRMILFFDTFEQLALEAAPWLLEYVLSSNLINNIVLVVGGRVPIDASTPDDPKAWLPYKEDETICSIALKSFTEDETREYLKERGITEPERVAATWQSSHGLPFYLSLLTSSLQGEIDPTKDVVDNFLRWIPPEEDVKRRLSLDGAFFSRPFSRDDLEAFEYLPKDFAYLPENKNEQTKLYNWLTGQDFVESILHDGRYSYRNMARKLFSYRLYQFSQREYFATRKALADYYQRLLEIIQSERGKGAYDSAEWLELAQALAYQLFMLPDEASHVKAIERVLAAFHKSKQKEAMLGTLRRLTQGQPDKQVTDDTRKVAEQLIQYIEADLGSSAFLAAANFLLEKAARAPLFSPEILSNIYRNRGLTLIQLNDPQRAIEDFNRAIGLSSDEGWIYGLRGFAYTLIGDIQTAVEDFNHALKLDPDEGWIYMGRGLATTAIGETQQAIKDLERAVELEPNDAGIYASRSFVYLAINEFEKALENANHALEMAPNEAWVYFSRGFANLFVHHNQQAIEDMNRVCELSPNMVYGYIGRGLVYASLNEPQKAIEDFDRAISLAPLLAQHYALRGDTFALLNRPEQAIEDFNRALELAPNYFMAYVGRGLVYSAQNKQEQAIEDFSHAIELAPNLSRAYSGRGIAHSALNQFEQAIADCDHAVELDPKDAWAYVRRGFVYSAQNKQEQAIEDFSHAIELAPNLSRAYSGRGFAHSVLNQFELAITDCDRGVELDPKDAWAYYYRGRAYLTHSDFQQAILDFNHAVELDPKLSQIYSARGLAYASINEPQQALEDCNYALELDQRDALAYVGRAAAYASLNQFKQIIEACNQALELAPNSAQSYLYRGGAYASLDEFQKAFDDFNYALELMPTQPQGYIGRGLVYASLNKPQQAFEDLNHALELAPSLPQAYIGQGHAYLILNEFEQAIGNFTHALELAPNLPQAYISQGHAYLILNEFEQAIGNFTHALELAPTLAPALLFSRGFCYLALKEYRQAIEDLDHANPDDPQTYTYRGFAYLMLGDLRSANADFTRSLELNPEDINVGCTAEWTKMCQENPDPEMAARLEAIAAISSQDYSAYICRAMTLWLQKHFEEALAELEQAIQLKPTENDAHFWKGMACTSLERDEEAMAAIEKSLMLDLPPVLLTPLHWFEQDRPDFYKLHVAPLLARYEL